MVVEIKTLLLPTLLLSFYTHHPSHQLIFHFFIFPTRIFIYNIYIQTELKCKLCWTSRFWFWFQTSRFNNFDLLLQLLGELSWDIWRVIWEIDWCFKAELARQCLGKTKQWSLIQEMLLCPGNWVSFYVLVVFVLECSSPTGIFFLFYLPSTFLSEFWYVHLLIFINLATCHLFYPSPGIWLLGCLCFIYSCVYWNWILTCLDCKVGIVHLLYCKVDRDWVRI